MTGIIEQALAKLRCEADAQHGNDCDSCRKPMHAGDPLYEIEKLVPRKTIFVCGKCAAAHIIETTVSA